MIMLKAIISTFWDWIVTGVKNLMFAVLMLVGVVIVSILGHFLFSGIGKLLGPLKAPLAAYFTSLWFPATLGVLAALIVIWIFCIEVKDEYDRLRSVK